MIADDILYIGVDDRTLDLFEGQYPIPNGVSYNSYVILDEKVAVMDTVDHRKTDAYLEKVCPYVTVAILSCAHLSAEDRAREMQKAADHGVSIVLGTIGEDGSYVLYNGKTYYASAVHADDVIDTMGAGDSYFAAFLCSLLKSSKSGALLDGTEEENVAHLQEAMQIGAAFAAKMCAKEGAFGYGTPIVGRTEL